MMYTEFKKRERKMNDNVINEQKCMYCGKQLVEDEQIYTTTLANGNKIVACDLLEMIKLLDEVRESKAD